MVYPRPSFPLPLVAVLCGELLLCVNSGTSSTLKKRRNVGSQLASNILKSLSEIKKDTKNIKQKIDELHQKIIGRASTCAKAKNCADLYKCGQKKNGVYKINPDGKGAFNVFCDQTTAGGGWTVFQRRKDGSVNFFRGWTEYQHGFGNLDGEFWLGLDRIHRLTHQQHYKLRVDLEDWNRKTAYAVYSMFGVANEGNKYKLSLGSYSGTAGDSLSYHRGMAFSTKDQDNDASSSSCAVGSRGAWWYNSCYYSNLNGPYGHGGNSDGTTWYHWKNAHYSVKKADMKIRPINFSPS